jgi:autotransporter-associated beta strand protein
VLTTNGDNASTTYSGSIQTGLTKAGTGTLTLTGTNTAYPATTVSAGTLQAGATNTFSPNSSMNVASGATLDLNSFNQAIGSLAGAGNVTLGSATLTAGGNNNSTVFSGVVSGTGALTKAGTGTLTLAGANTYTGGTTVSAGTLQLGNGGSSGSIVGDITDNGVVAFDRSDAPVFSHVISGTGAVDITGSGTIVFTGSNTYSGGTTIASGTLALGNGGTSGWISGNVTGLFPASPCKGRDARRTSC